MAQLIFTYHVRAYAWSPKHRKFSTMSDESRYQSRESWTYRFSSLLHGARFASSSMYNNQKVQVSMKIFSLYRKLPSSNFSVPAELKKYLQLSYFAVPHLIPLSSMHLMPSFFLYYSHRHHHRHHHHSFIISNLHIHSHATITIWDLHTRHHTIDSLLD